MSNGTTDSLVTDVAFGLKKQVDPVEMSVEVLIFLFFKAFSAMRTYSPEHPLFQNALQHLFQTFTEFFEAHDQLRIELSELEILFNGQVVYQEQEKRGSVIFILFNDGVREIRFEKGLTRDEIKAFLDALRINAELPQEERDIVSLLWSKDFSNIRYFAFDEIPDQAVEYVDRGISELETTQQGLDSMDIKTMIGEIQSQLDTSGSGGNQLAPYLEPPILSQMMTKSQDAIEDLLESLNVDRNFDAESELIGIIFDVLRLEEKSDRSLSLLKLFENYSDDLLARGALAQVNRIINDLQMLTKQGSTDSFPLSQRVDEILNRFAEEKVHGLQKMLREASLVQPADLCTFIALLRPQAIEPICGLLEEVSDQKMRTQIVNGLEILAQGQISRLGQSLIRASELAARDIVNVLGKIGDDGATAILKICVSHKSATIREEAIRALRRISTPQAQEAMIPYLSDKNPTIRTVAAEGIEACRTPYRVNSLSSIIRKKTFNKRSYREKKALLSILGKDGSKQSIHMLETLLSKRGLFNRKLNDETRACAAMALGKVQSMKSSATLKRYSQDSSPSVSKACVQALRNQ